MQYSQKKSKDVSNFRRKSHVINKNRCVSRKVFFKILIFLRRFYTHQSTVVFHREKFVLTMQNIKTTLVLERTRLCSGLFTRWYSY